MVKAACPSHSLLISPGHAPGSIPPGERKCCASVFARTFHHALVVLVASAVLLAGAAGVARADDGGQPPAPGGGPNDKPSPSRPSAKVRGLYVVRIAGYYSGTGEARASDAGIKISAKVKDPNGKDYSFQAKKLDIVDDRFTGTGTLEGVEVNIDGRVDPQDTRGNEVLKKGRITFTFSANGHHSRGVGELRQASAAVQ